jgi:hypothetical protein
MAADKVGLDLLAVEAFTWTPTLETACEICLREAHAGRRVGFAFLDIENVDQFPLAEDIRFGRLVYRVGRRSRIQRVRRIEAILLSHGVQVINPGPPPGLATTLSSTHLGIDSPDALRDFRISGAALGIGTLSSLVRHLGDSAPEVEAHRDVVDLLLTSAWRAYLLTVELINRWAPSTVLLYNGRFAISKGVSEAARLAGVEVRHHEIVSTTDRYYYSKHSVHSLRHSRRDLRDAWQTAGGDREAIGAAYFAPERGGNRLFETQFLEHQTRDQVIPRDHRRRIAYFISSIDEYAAVEDGFECPLFDSQHAGALWLASWVCHRPDTELIIRLHPRMRMLSDRERGWWDSLSAPNVTVLHAESPVDSYGLAAGSDRVVAYHSSIGAEASYLGAVSILIGDADYRGLDCVYEPDTPEELERLLLDPDLGPKSSENCLPFGYQRLMRGNEYRFYQPASFQEGSFFGHRMTPDREEPAITRVTIRALHRLERMVRRSRGDRNGLRSG